MGLLPPLPILIAVSLTACALALAGPGCRRFGSAVVELSRSTRSVIIPAITAVTLAGVFALPYTDLTAYAVYLGASTATFAALLVIAWRTEPAAERLVASVGRLHPIWIASAVLVAAVLACRVVLDDIPHITDEIAYLFQARAIAEGRLSIDVPPLPEFFAMTHTLMDGGRWFGIMPPGWPALLAVGELAHMPWLVNPVLAAASILLFAGAFGRMGLSRFETRLALTVMAISPFVVFLSGSYMSHAASLFWFAAFTWGWVGLTEVGGWRYAAVAGIALGAHVLVRPADAVVSAVPLLLQPLLAGRGGGWRWRQVALVAVLAAAGVGLTLAYNAALTGEWMLAPTAKYFADSGMGRFGIGFGADMGTTLHGPEWPGFYPSDAVRVSSYRLTELIQDFNGMPLMLVALVVLSIRCRPVLRPGWERAMLLSAGAIVAFYALHFYHGVAFGARHYYLAVPALAVLTARSISEGRQHAHANVRRLARLGAAAGLVHVLLFAYPPLVQRYGNAYRLATPSILEFADSHAVSNAVVFVDGAHWGWKSAAFLNRYPLESNDVIFARDQGDQNRDLMARFPDRTYYHLRIVGQYGSRVEVRPVDPTTPSAWRAP